jgi:uncharacterized protein YkwD
MNSLIPILFIAVALITNSLSGKTVVLPGPVTTPTPIPMVTPTLVPPSTPKPKLNISPTVTPDNQPWGVARQVSEHTWTIKVQNDAVMGTPQEILGALNDLRIRNGSQKLIEDSNLCSFAKTRADYFNSIKKTDSHQGFTDYLRNQDGFRKLGYGLVGENSSYGYVMSGVHLIEFIYNSDPDHSFNQLDPKWDHACVGVSGSATNLIFATSPL